MLCKTCNSILLTSQHNINKDTSGFYKYKQFNCICCKYTCHFKIHNELTRTYWFEINVNGHYFGLDLYPDKQTLYSNDIYINNIKEQHINISIPNIVNDKYIDISSIQNKIKAILLLQ